MAMNNNRSGVYFSGCTFHFSGNRMLLHELRLSDTNMFISKSFTVQTFTHTHRHNVTDDMWRSSHRTLLHLLSPLTKHTVCYGLSVSITSYQHSTAPQAQHYVATTHSPVILYFCHNCVNRSFHSSFVTDRQTDRDKWQ